MGFKVSRVSRNRGLNVLIFKEFKVSGILGFEISMFLGSKNHGFRFACIKVSGFRGS
jgi:hypothetical protein